MNKIKIMAVIIALDVSALFINHVSLLVASNSHSIIIDILLFGVFIGLTRRLIKEKHSVVNKSLIEAKNRYDLAIEGAGGIIWEMNFSSRESYLNGKVAEMLGITAGLQGDFTIKDWVTYVHEEDKERLTNLFNREPKELFDECKDGISIEYRVYKNDGSLLWILTKAKMIVENGEYVLLGVNLDISELEAAMYKAKENGKNRYQFFNNEISKELDRNYNIEKGLRTALENNELFVQFQPKVVLEDSKIMGFEALIRWKSEELGFVSPVEFIPVAEDTRMIIPIGRFVIEEVFKKCKQLIDMGYEDFKIALNLSEIQLRDGDVINDFESISKQYGVSSKYIEVEITESLLMKSVDKNIEILLKLKEFGVSIALDDFGTGYSSLNYLTKLPIDVLKIDRSFVMEINGDGKSQYIVENIIQLSHKLGIKVVAEGVELQEQVDYLKSILCDFVQGYYYSKPQDFDKIVNLMESRYFIDVKAYE